MKRLNKYMMLFVAALALVSCVDDVVETPSTEAKAGDEVQFSLTLPSSRTVYGGETTVGGKNVFPIYWVDGDKVTIFSPQCLDGRRSAEYKVILPDNGDKAYYAKDLQKIGAYGVQWGNNATADFYSLYPSGDYTLSSDGKNAEGVTINYNQNITVNSDGSVTSDMEDCLLYAKKTGVASGETVNLHYDPISTVLYVTLKVAANDIGTDADTFTIQSVSLIADKDIAGTFNLDIANGTFAGFATGKSSKTVMAQIANPSTGGYHVISNGESFSIPLFIAPQTDLNVKNWKIQVVANNNEYTKTLNIDKVLEPGQIHKITLPELKPATTEWVVSKWMTYIPRNVYLSEVSIPGSWNSLNPEFQPNTTEGDKTIEGTSISNQYDRGVRAFHLDTRWQGGGSALRPTVSNVLGVANGGKTVEYQNNARVMTDSDNPSVESALDEIISNIKSDEYMVLMCTFAQGSYNHSYTTDGVAYDWVGEISRICSTKTDVYDAKKLTPNTLVGDVLGKVIVIVNMEGAFTTVPSDSKCLFINAPLKLTNDLFPTTLDDDKNKTNLMTGTAGANTPSDTNIDIYNTQAQVCIAGETYTGSQSRDNVDARGFAPTFGERKTVANNILNWSKNNYGTTNYAHDKWIYLGLGGYYMYYDDGFYGIGSGWKAASGGHKNVASDCNTWIDGKVKEMGTTPSGQTAVVPYYPVGIVLMNCVNTYKDNAVKSILMLNNKYRLQYDASKPTDYNPNAKARSAYDGTLNTGGNAY